MRESSGDVLALKEKYNLHNTPEVNAAAKRTQLRTGERVPQDPTSRIENYLNRFQEILDRPDQSQRERGIDAIKRLFHSKYVIKSEDIPDSYWENQKRLLRERGQGGDLAVADWQAVKDQNSEALIADQRSSLDNWIDYLTSGDAAYPQWLKYWAMRNIVSMSKFDKVKKDFPKRSQGTTNPFPEIDREALSYVLDLVQKKRQGDEIKPPFELVAEEQTKFNQLLEGESFPKLYAWAIEKVTPASTEQLSLTEGKWIKYDQKSDHRPLVKSLQGHGTGWCTAGESTAQIQLEGGDFYVYYSNDLDGQATIPRVAIRMDDDHIAEVRGIAKDQNLDPYIENVVQEKLQEFPDRALYEKRMADTKMLTYLEIKAKDQKDFTRDELIFLYEIESSIQGFGYKKDPRITELRSVRNTDKDISTIFECSEEQIAHERGEIKSDTKVYVGELTTGIFDRLPPEFEHIYRSFPEKTIVRTTITIGGTPKDVLVKQMLLAEVDIEWAKDILASQQYTTAKTAEEISLVRLQVSDLGFTHHPTTAELYQKALEIGLELCPAEVGPQYRLKYTNQPKGEVEWVHIGMQALENQKGSPLIFRLALTKTEKLRLADTYVGPSTKWELDHKFVFCQRKLNQ